MELREAVTRFRQDYLGRAGVIKVREGEQEIRVLISKRGLTAEVPTRFYGHTVKFFTEEKALGDFIKTQKM